MRINLIEPSRLTDQHLIAEYNELRMAMMMLKKSLKTNSPIPKKFCLGAGHILFFKDKIYYLVARHRRLRKEMIHRGFHPQYKVDIHEFPKKYWKDYKPDKESYNVITQRIGERISQKPEWYRYYGKHFPEQFYLNLLTK
jgi:deoxyribonuclease (pyrimidine dimer)